jgi:L-lactate dehydrogenase complex protein LldE
MTKRCEDDSLFVLHFRGFIDISPCHSFFHPLNCHNMSEPKRIALFTTCLVDQLMPEIGVSTVKLLRRVGCQVDYPAGQTCCGQPFFNSGYLKEATRLAKRTIEVLETAETVVLPSGSCATMIRAEYAHLLEDEPKWHYRAKRLAAKSFELSEFLSEQAEWPGPGEASPGSVTYHDSCHMCRHLGLRQQPRDVLRAAGREVKEMAESERCCGFGGLFSIKMPEVSNAMTAEKLRLAADSGAKTIVTADPGCLMQMRGLAGDDLQVKHIATVLEESLP